MSNFRPSRLATSRNIIIYLLMMQFFNCCCFTITAVLTFPFARVFANYVLFLILEIYDGGLRLDNRH
jgi:hypothetical protein